MPAHVNELEWQQAMNLARQSCARMFKDGRSPGQAMAAFGLASDAERAPDWSKAVTHIADVLCCHPLRKAA
jgi:hypothetical protein